MTVAPPTTYQPRFIDLAREARIARRQADAKLADTALTASTYELLHYLERSNGGGRSQINLQQQMSISKAALSEAITNLEKRRLVKRVTPKDKRLRIVNITQTGRAALEEARQVLAVTGA